MKKIIIKSLGFLINLTAGVFPKWNTKFSFNLFCKVRRVGISEKGKAFFDRGETIHLGKESHHAVLHKWGTGPKAILFMHGWASNAQRWMRYVDLLDLEKYTVYAIDAPGHGMSSGKVLNLEMYRQAVVHTIKKIGIVDVLVSHSVGSMTASYLFLHNPEVAVKKYVIMGAPSGMDAIFVYYKNVLGLNKRAMKNIEAKVTEVLQIKHEELRISRFFKQVKAPIFVIHDEDDKITPFAPIKAAVTRNIETLYTKGQGHNLRAPETVESVVEFINR
jgi:pimeloyl-ACP methyl ester carboxylesterase